MQYLFSWDKIPGEDIDRFTGFLERNFGAGWVRTAKIEKLDAIINVTSENHYLSLKLNSEKTRALLTIDFGRTEEFIVKTENGRINIYLMQKDREYLYSLKSYLIAMTGIFILSIIIGFFVSINNPGLPDRYAEMLKNSFGWIKDLSPIGMMLVIFVNNAVKSLLALVFGVVLGIPPIFFVAGNGIVLSILVDSVSRQQGTLFVLAATVPHGIIEIPMVLLSASIGLKLGYLMYQSLKGVKVDIKQEFNLGFRFYIRWILPLLFVAAMIETFVTPLIAFQFIGK